MPWILYFMSIKLNIFYEVQKEPNLKFCDWFFNNKMLCNPRLVEHRSAAAAAQPSKWPVQAMEHHFLCKSIQPWICLAPAMFQQMWLHQSHYTSPMTSCWLHMPCHSTSQTARELLQTCEVQVIGPGIATTIDFSCPSPTPMSKG